MNIREIQRNDIKELSKLFDKYRIFYKKKSDLQAAEKFLNERFQNNESIVFVAESSAKDSEGKLVLLIGDIAMMRFKKSN
ncbi:hypothetical protein [Halpernia sp.]|uniref:hypothetical protein n=1 Tax=Halpernia sp. TaxID=2782209 RepID=UPI003A90DC0B